MAASWGKLIGLCLCAYMSINACFAGLYCMWPGCVHNAVPGAFSDAFWFSVQTFATIGFGVMSPANTYAHALVTIESFLGLFSLAVGTGIVFSKFSRPTARLGFSQFLLISRHNHRPCLTFRVAHERRGGLVDVTAKVSVLVDERTAEGVVMRRVRDLELERSRMPMLALAWSVFHIIDESSPLFGITPENSVQKLVALFVIISGVDDTTLETILSRHSYSPDALRFGARFADMMERLDNGRLVVHHDRLNNILPLDAASLTEDPA